MVAYGSSQLLFAASLGKQTIIIFNGSGKEVGSIRTGIGPLATDRHGDLYVAPNQQGYANKVEIYAPPYTGSPTVLNIKGQIVLSVAVDAVSGVFAVTSTSSKPGGGPSRETFFRSGGRTPCATVMQPPNTARFYGHTAFDREGTLFDLITLNNSVLDAVAIRGGCNAKTAQLLSFHESLVDAGQLAFNADDNMVLQAYPGGRPGPIYTYAHPKGGMFGAPIATTNLQPQKGYTPIFNSMSSDGHHLWADYINPEISLYDYPGGGPPVKSFPIYNAIYAAVSPPLIP